jgi:hypothetical protein
MLEFEQISEVYQRLKFTVVVLELWIGRSLFKCSAALQYEKTYVSRQDVPSGYLKNGVYFKLMDQFSSG